MRGLLWILVMWAGVAATVSAAPPVILVWGDSLSSAYGMPLQQGWVSLLQRKLQAAGYPHRVVNGSVTGETTAGGLSRLPAALAQHKPALLLLELGGNDGLRGLPAAQLRANLKSMIVQARKAGARSLVFEMQMPPNYGEAYRTAFNRSFAEVAQAERARLVPFFLAPIATDPASFLDDGIHPAAAAQPALLEAAWPSLRAELGPAASASARKP